MKLKIAPWLQVLVSGLLLFIATERALILTDNAAYLPTVLMLGAFVIPISFVTYFYEHVKHREISLPLLTTSFFVGGTLGLLAAGVLEWGSLSGLGIPGLLTVGLIEESVKLLFPLAMFIMWRYRHEADGLLFGIAAGMGFAALETMGYGMVTFIESKGNFTTLEQVLLLRGFLSPAGHAAWTGFVCAVMWRERQRKERAVISLSVIGAFLLAVLLHTIWDIVNSVGVSTLQGFASIIIGNIIIAAISLTLVIRRYREAKRSLAANTASSG